MGNNSKKYKKLVPKSIRDLYNKYYFKKYHAALKTKKDGKLLIIGCGRSGTSHVSTIFKELNINLGHEKLGDSGLSSWYLVSDHGKAVNGPSFPDIKDLELPMVHQIRHPLKAISSMQAFGWRSWAFLANEIPIDNEKDSLVLKAMKYWYYWNLKAEKKASYSYQVENFENEFHKILSIGGFDSSVAFPTHVGKKTNSRKHSSLSWEDLEREDTELCQLIKDTAIRYKYEL